MELALEAIKGGGGSIKVGATGTISALMSKELLDPLTKPIARPKSKTNEASSSSTTTMGPFKTHRHQHQKGLETLRKKKNRTGSGTHQIPMLTADDSMSIDGTPIRKPKPDRRGPAGVVEIVDIKCGGSDRKWVNPIKDRLKKLNFWKLSESII